MSATLTPRSLIYATDIDVLPLDRVIERRDGYLVVRSPGNPTHYWGNLLLFDAPPAAGDGERWERLFQQEFASQPATRHRTFGWDVTEAVLGAARPEFVARGYDLERNVGLVATPEQLTPHPRANREVEVRALDPAEHGPDQALWDQVVELTVAGGDPLRFEPADQRAFARARTAELRVMFRAGRGAWYVALAGDEVAASCGVVVTAGRARFQSVETLARFRRRGICRRLVADAGRDAIDHHGAERLVIVADPDYHALGLYEGLGFVPAERNAGVCRPPHRAR